MRLRRQVSTQAKRCAKFLTKLNKKAAKGDGDIAIVEVCGFNAWLLVILLSIGCAKSVLAQPTKKLKVKTDRRLNEGIVTRSRWDPTNGMYRGAIGNGKNDLQLARTKDPSITDRYDNRTETWAPYDAPEQV